MRPNLCEDIYHEILIHIQDSVELYKCLFVSRLWCRITVPLLWKNPFEISPCKKHDLIMRTYISCLNDEELA
ncbi:12935_t:CDS:1, partial [Acaulospora morrowiae]